MSGISCRRFHTMFFLVECLYKILLQQAKLIIYAFFFHVFFHCSSSRLTYIYFRYLGTWLEFFSLQSTISMLLSSTILLNLNYARSSREFLPIRFNQFREYIKKYQNYSTIGFLLLFLIFQRYDYHLFLCS